MIWDLWLAFEGASSEWLNESQRYLGHVGQSDVAIPATDPDQEGGFEGGLVEAREGLPGVQWLELGGSQDPGEHSLASGTATDVHGCTGSDSIKLTL